MKHLSTAVEQVAKILTAAKLQRVSDHFSKQQRRNIEMWLKMTEVRNVWYGCYLENTDIFKETILSIQSGIIFHINRLIAKY